MNIHSKEKGIQRRNTNNEFNRQGNLYQREKTKKSKMIATIVAVSVIAVATIGLVVGLVVGVSGQITHERQAEADRIADQISEQARKNLIDSFEP